MLRHIVWIAVVSAAVAAAKSSSKSDEDENCQDSVMGYNFQGNQVGRRVRSLHLSFENVKTTTTTLSQKSNAAPLNACERFAKYTCCNRTHTDMIRRKDLETAAAGFGSRCRDWSSIAMCMPCQGDVGLGKIKSICSSSCDEWFDSCRAEYYMSETVSYTHLTLPTMS